MGNRAVTDLDEVGTTLLPGRPMSLAEMLGQVEPTHVVAQASDNMARRFREAGRS